jgi:hypothetical protein
MCVCVCVCVYVCMYVCMCVCVYMYIYIYIYIYMLSRRGVGRASLRQYLLAARYYFLFTLAGKKKSDSSFLSKRAIEMNNAFPLRHICNERYS